MAEEVSILYTSLYDYIKAKPQDFVIRVHRLADTDEELKLYIFKFNNKIYFHPLEVAKLFGLS